MDSHEKHIPADRDALLCLRKYSRSFQNPESLGLSCWNETTLNPRGIECIERPAEIANMFTLLEIVNRTAWIKPATVTRICLKLSSYFLKIILPDWAPQGTWSFQGLDSGAQTALFCISSTNVWKPYFCLPGIRWRVCMRCLQSKLLHLTLDEMMPWGGRWD